MLCIQLSLGLAETSSFHGFCNFCCSNKLLMQWKVWGAHGPAAGGGAPGELVQLSLGTGLSARCLTLARWRDPRWGECVPTVWPGKGWMVSSKSIPPNHSGTKQGCSQCRGAAAEPRFPCRAVPLPAVNIFQCHFKMRAGKAEQCRAVAQQLGCRCVGKPTPTPQHPFTSPSLRPHTPSACGGCILEEGSSLILHSTLHLCALPRGCRAALQSGLR